jgi:hypothetical protein
MTRNGRRWCMGISALAGVAWGGGARAAQGDGPPAPPPEAIQACSGLAEGASCSVTWSDGSGMAGTCRSGPQGEPAACMPERSPRGAFRPPPEAIRACASLGEGAACTFTLPDGHQLSGACRAAPDGSGTACAPGGPPPQR